MIIIVEGIDRVGKTILCQKISDYLGFSIFKDKSPILHNQQEITKKFIVLMRRLKSYENVIVDRFHMTELVYNSFRGDDFESYLDFDKELAKLSTLLILVRSENIVESSKQHGADLFGHEMMFRALYLGTNIKNKKSITYSDFDAYARALANTLAGGMFYEDL